MTTIPNASYMSVSILGVRVDCVDLETILEYFTRAAESRRSRRVTYVNAHCLTMARTNPQYRNVLNQCDLIYTDGIGAVWSCRMLSGVKVKKITSADWIDQVWALAEKHQWRIYILASAPGVIPLAIRNIREGYPRLNIVGYCDGFFIDKSETDVIEEIHQYQPDLIMVGLGVPKQEIWMDQHYKELPMGVWWGVGALFDYIARVEVRAPAYVRRVGLEWLWRFFVNPRDKWRRVLLGIPAFIFRVAYTRWRYGKNIT